MIDNAIYTDTGQVVLRYYMPAPKSIRIDDVKYYVTQEKYGVSLLFVDEVDVPRVLDAEGGCCGGKRKIFSLCSQDAYTVWKTGDR
jgi:hypothetical protein